MRSVTFTADNLISLLHCGAEYFPALEAAFDAARAEIYLETYIFADDATAERIKQALIRAAARGVAVYVITDWLGTGHEQNARLQQQFLAAGVQHRIYNPWFRRGLSRLHRKLCVVDRQVAFVGGLNINHDMHDDENPHIVLPAPRWDFAVRIVGPLVDAIHQEMEAQWARLGHRSLKARWEQLKALRRKPEVGAAEQAMAALVVRDNLRNRHTIQRAYLQALGHARQSAWLANPYFAPGRKLRVALSAAAARGVDVTLLIGTGQFRMQDAVARSYYPKLLRHGVKIVEYRKTQLHGKVAVVDDHWATVGSSNYDGLSLFVNQEANVLIKDHALCTALRRHIETGVLEGAPVALADFAAIPWYKRIWYDAAFLFYQATIRIIAWGHYS